jgi:hypothetical protein
MNTRGGRMAGRLDASSYEKARALVATLETLKER